ncbi:hemerythrin domain-containing protein [Nocardia huaxiensis]|uniref:Hemerythrin domain-containing protein n=1 Tax=Nocardia huaxiensis TaxID=2755382 RepID=A0A7D6V786_9NOCA|nr:hemerythrin domain-containing protein [Nocardia huaxiensis]QLY29332.1 hemerythrin domain-containing protein [Nocardia huaxiensis]UFS97191.1 hemerythrin domain-containing protein [Nocardia huaxiensis]
MTARTETSQPADTRVMGIVHTALRRDLARARAALTEWPYPFDDQRRALADHLVWMMRFLEHHHESEDQHLYPMVRARNAQARALLDRMNADHESITPAMAAVEGTAAAYRESADARDRVIEALDALSGLLLPHLEREEQQMMPIVSATITDAEWRHWDDEYNVKPLGPLDLSDQGLFILDGLKGAEREAITELVPAVPRWIILNLMIHRYRRQAFARWRTPEFSPLKTPLRGRTEVATSASPHQVWKVLADVTRVGEWSHECRSARWLDGSTVAAVGARFKGCSASGLLRWSRACTMTVAEEPRELAWITHGGVCGDTTEWRFTLEPAATGTRIVQTYRILSLPVWFDRLVWFANPAHHDRAEALRADLTRLAHLAGESP